MEPFDFQQELIDKLGVPEIVSRLVGDEMGLLPRKNPGGELHRLPLEEGDIPERRAY